MWLVFDDGSRRIAQSFYEWLCAGEPIGEALRQARLDAYERGDPTWRHTSCSAVRATGSGPRSGHHRARRSVLSANSLGEFGVDSAELRQDGRAGRGAEDGQGALISRSRANRPTSLGETAIEPDTAKWDEVDLRSAT